MTQRSNATRRTFDLLRLQRQGSGSFIADMQNHTCAILCGPVKQRDCRSQEAVHKGTAHGKGEADGKSKGGQGDKETLEGGRASLPHSRRVGCSEPRQ